MAEPSAETPTLGIVVPVLNEAGILEHSLSDLFARDWIAVEAEVIVCDGGSSDASSDIAKRFPCRLLHSEPGRARQMNVASAALTADYLLFLHADSRLPPDFHPRDLAGADWGFFRLRLSGDGVGLRIVERAINLRTRLTRIATGDQGLFFRRERFMQLGCYPEIALMEDIAITKLARRQHAPRMLSGPMVTSSRRWRQRGLLRTILLMWSLRLAYWIGVDPARLKEIYYPGRR